MFLTIECLCLLGAAVVLNAASLSANAPFEHTCVRVRKVKVLHECEREP